MKLFIERGFNACSVQDITAAAGVPKGSFYNHFKSKEALGAEVLTEYGKGTTDRSILTRSEVPALARLKKHFAALNEYFSRCNDGCLVGKFMAEVSDDTPQIRARLRSVLSLWGEQISSVIAAGQQQGSIRVSGTPPIVFSRMRSERSQPGRSLSPREENAFTFQVPLIRAAFSDLRFGNRIVALPQIQEPGRAFLFDLSARPTVGLDTQFDNVRCYISQRTLDDLAYARGLRRIGGLVQRSFGERDPVLFHLAKMLVPVLDSPDTASSAFIEYVALALHEHVITKYGGVPVTARTRGGGLAPWQPRRACAFIEAHLDGDPSIASLSRECHVSASYFARAFRTTVGMAPHRWVMKRRTERAKSLMMTAELSLAQIASMCGFVDQSHLSRVFAREAGMSPARWRRLRMD